MYGVALSFDGLTNEQGELLSTLCDDLPLPNQYVDTDFSVARGDTDYGVLGYVVNYGDSYTELNLKVHTISQLQIYEKQFKEDYAKLIEKEPRWSQFLNNKEPNLITFGFFQ